MQDSKWANIAKEFLSFQWTNMEILSSKYCYLVTFALGLLCLCVRGDDSCPTSSCTCNYGTNGNQQEVHDLQDRVTCLEANFDQLT